MIKIKLPDGREFNSLKECAYKLNMSYATAYSRFNLCQPPFGNIQFKNKGAKGKPVYFRGKRYKNKAEAARAYNITPSAVWQELRRKNNVA